jgi:hypothetical protein
MTTKTTVTGEPRLASLASWAVLTASFALSAATWIAMARLAGFGHRLDLHLFTVDLAWLMPVAVDGYVVVALVLWMSPVPTAVALFAKRNTYAAAGVGIAAQSVYHALLTASTASTHASQAVFAAVIGALPPSVAGLAVHMRALIRRDGATTAAEPAAADDDTEPTPAFAAEPTPEPAAPVGPVVPSGFLPRPAPPSTPVNGRAVILGGAQ